MRLREKAYSITLAAFLAAALFPGCRSTCGPERRAQPASTTAGATPRETVQSYIIFKEAEEAAGGGAHGAPNGPARLLTKRANAAVEKIAGLEHEQITGETQKGGEAEILAKKQYYELDPRTGIIARSGEYAEFLYKLRKEDNAWKIDNIATRMRGAGEYGGFTPKWRAYRIKK